jgi:hypothetical protein
VGHGWHCEQNDNADVIWLASSTEGRAFVDLLLGNPVLLFAVVAGAFVIVLAFVFGNSRSRK